MYQPGRKIKYIACSKMHDQMKLSSPSMSKFPYLILTKLPVWKNGWGQISPIDFPFGHGLVGWSKFKINMDHIWFKLNKKWVGESVQILANTESIQFGHLMNELYPKTKPTYLSTTNFESEKKLYVCLLMNE